MKNQHEAQSQEEPKSNLGKLEQSVKGVREMMLHHEKNKTKFKIILASVFTFGLICFGLLWSSAPKLTEAEKLLVLKFPRSPSDLSNILKVIERYNADN